LHQAAAAEEEATAEVEVEVEVATVEMIVEAEGIATTTAEAEEVTTIARVAMTTVAVAPPPVAAAVEVVAERAMPFRRESALAERVADFLTNAPRAPRTRRCLSEARAVLSSDVFSRHIQTEKLMNQASVSWN
jgi:hypothetical protein